MSPLVRRVIDGVGHTMPFAVGLSFIALVRVGVNPQRAAQSGLPTLDIIIAQYLAVGLCTGVVLGLARPLATSNAGKGFVGFLTALVPTLFVIAFRYGRTFVPTRGDVLTALVLACLVGVATAAYFSVNEERRRQSQRGDA